ncbi:TPA: hypothetical protein DEP21_04490 [Patescibacteria group bacterium]|nr:hypothetical protein [Candidatus Gracilibacteria bacterium]
MGTQLTPTEGSSFKKALSLKIEMDQQESLKNDAIVSDIQKSLTNVLTYIPLTPTDPSPEEMKNLLQEIDDIENALSTND